MRITGYHTNSSDGGLILVRELDEHLGFGELIEPHLTDCSAAHPPSVASLLRRTGRAAIQISQFWAFGPALRDRPRRKGFGLESRLERCLLRLSGVNYRLAAKSRLAKGKAEMAKDKLRPEYDLSRLGRGVRGKYYRQAKAGTNLVLIEPDLAKAFPDQESVKRALHLLVSTASATTRGSRRPGKPRRHGTAPNQRPKRRHSGR